jgi:hypothetical protein
MKFHILLNLALDERDWVVFIPGAVYHQGKNPRKTLIKDLLFTGASLDAVMAKRTIFPYCALTLVFRLKRGLYDNGISM